MNSKSNNSELHEYEIPVTSFPLNEGNKNNTILLVDDDIALTFIAQKSLEAYGFKVLVASNAEDALDYYCQELPSVILLDLAMPKVNGFELCRLIRLSEHGANVPIVVMTGHDEREYVDRAYDNGVTDFIHKPINWRILENRLQYIWKANELEKLKTEKLALQQVILNHIAD